MSVHETSIAIKCLTTPEVSCVSSYLCESFEKKYFFVHFKKLNLYSMMYFQLAPG